MRIIFVFVFLLGLFFACSESSNDKTRVSALLLVEKEEGVYYYNEKKFNGIAYTKHKNGELWTEAHITKGKINSIKSFSEKGELWYENKYKKGVLHKTLDYYENGKLSGETFYKEGKIISENCWDINGRSIKCD